VNLPARVVLLTTELRPAGAERVVYELATRLDRSRFNPVVVSLLSRDRDDGAFTDRLRAAGVPVFPLRVRSKVDLPRVVPLVRLLRSLRPRIVHAHLFHANLVARLVAPLAGNPRVVSTHHVVERRPLGPRFLLDRLTARLDDRTVAVSHACARFAERVGGARRDRLVVVDDGIDLVPFRSGNGTHPSSLRAELGLEPGALLVGAVGRLAPQKGHADLVRAWRRVRAAFPTATLAIAGEGPARPLLERLTRDLGIGGSVRLVGHVSDVPSFLAALDLFVMPSRWEGFGLALLEALASGRACVASTADSLPEVVGSAGLLVPPSDPAALGAAIVRLLSDPGERARLGAEARVRADAFSVEKMVAGYEEVYESLL
jgi:glycosyltransferase involved in cell wall biosynthesis